MIYKKLFFLIVLVTLFAGNAYSEKDFEFLYFHIDESSDTYKISYKIVPSENISEGDIFILNIFHNDEFLDDCVKKLEFDSETIFKKITCEVSKSGSGKYKFEATLNRDGSEYTKIVNVESVKPKILEMNESTIAFEDLGDKTKISIKVNQSGTVVHFIPKEVIEELTEENKDLLITSDLEYEILESDPLIAWNVKSAPTTINYTINKKVNSEDMNNFKVEISQDPHFQGIKYLVMLLILVVIALALKPMFKSNKINN